MALNLGRQVGVFYQLSILWQMVLNGIKQYKIFLQAFPTRFAWFKKVLEHVMREKYAYLFMSFNPETPAELILRSKIFYNLGETPIVYL